MLKGKAKTDYQREYMRRRRNSVRPNNESVRPITDYVRPDVRPKTQSFNPMMVGYVPPTK